MAFLPTRDPAVYEKLREAFVTRVEKPTYATLAEEFGIPFGTIGCLAADERWQTLRAAHFEQRAKETDTLALLTKAVDHDQRAINAATDVALSIFAQLAKAAQEIPEDRAASTRAEICNALSFALKNTCDALKTIGVAGVAKSLSSIAQGDNGRWNPEMLQQINVTVQNLQAGQAKEAVTVAQVTKASEPGDKPPISTANQ